MAEADINESGDGGGGGEVDAASVLAALAENEESVDLNGQAITNVGNVDGADVSSLKTKLDTIETNADVTDAANVAAAGAVMDADFGSNGLCQRDGAGTYSVLSAANHAAAHLTGGSAAIQLATNSQPGLMSAAHVAALEAAGSSGAGLASLASEVVTDLLPGSRVIISLDPALADEASACVTVLETHARTAESEVLPADSVSRWDRKNSARAATLTPSATSGSAVTLTLGSGTWADTDLGQTVTGNAGVATITAHGGGTTCTALVSTPFADTSAIASGSWEEHAVVLSSDTLRLSFGGEDPDILAFVVADGSDGDTSIVDAVGHSVVVGGGAHVETDQSKYRSASIYVDGSGDYVQVSDHADIRPSGEWTLEFWYRAPLVTANMWFAFGRGASVGGVNIYQNSIFASSNASTWNLISGTAFGASNNTWHHICFQVTDDGAPNYRLRVFRDGAVIATSGQFTSWTWGTGANGGLILGKWTTYEQAGYFDDVVLSARSKYNIAGFTPPTSQLLIGAPMTGTHLVTTSAVGQVSTSDWTDINSVAVTDTGSGLYYAFSTDDQATWKIAKTGASPRSIVRNNSGTWEYNSHATYGSTTWSAAATNSQDGAFDDAAGVAANLMDEAQVEAVADSEWIAPGTTLDVAILLVGDGIVDPTFSTVTVNFAASSEQRVYADVDISVLSDDAVAVRNTGATALSGTIFVSGVGA